MAKLTRLAMLLVTLQAACTHKTGNPDGAAAPRDMAQADDLAGSQTTLTSCAPGASGLIVAGSYGSVFANYDNCVLAYEPAAGSTVINPKGTLFAVDEHGQRQVVTSNYGGVSVGAHVVFVQTGSSLTYWTREHGSVSPTVTGTLGSPMLSDASHVVYNVTSDNVVASVYAVGLDGSGATDLDDSMQVLANVYGISGGRLVVQDQAAVRSFAFDGSAAATLATSPAYGIVLGPTGVLLGDATDTARFAPVAGGAPVAIGGGHPAHPTGFGGAAFTSAGDAVVYISSDATKVLLRAPTSGAAPTVLLPAGAAAPFDFVRLSPDDKWVLYDTKVAGGHGASVGDLSLASATAQQAPLTVNAAATTLIDPPQPFGFTDDSQWVYYEDGSDSQLHVMAVDGTGARALGRVVTTPSNSPYLETAGGARLVWTDNAGALWWIDLAVAGATPQQIAAQLAAALAYPDKSWAVSADKSTVYYALAGAKPGIYATPLQ